MCHLRQRQGHHADVTVRPLRGLPEVLREDDTDGGVTATATSALCHLSCQDLETEADAAAQDLAAARLRLLLRHGRQDLGRALSQSVQHGCAQLRVPLLHDLGLFLFIRCVVRSMVDLSAETISKYSSSIAYGFT